MFHINIPNTERNAMKALLYHQQNVREIYIRQTYRKLYFNLSSLAYAGTVISIITICTQFSESCAVHNQHLFYEPKEISKCSFRDSLRLSIQLPREFTMTAQFRRFTFCKQMTETITVIILMNSEQRKRAQEKE